MLDREHSLRFDASAFLRGLTGRNFGLRTLGHARISGLGIELASLTTGDPLIATEISKGKFNFGGLVMSGLPLRLFELAPPSAQWQALIHSLQWLNHFAASGQELHRIVARRLIEKWSEGHVGRLGSRVHSNALISLSLAANFLVGGSTTYDASLSAIVERHISRVAAHRPSDAADRLLQAVSMLYASLAFRASPSLREDAIASFGQLVGKVILPDGGHVSRDPMQLFETLLLFIPIRDTMLAHHQPVPHALSAAIERMIPMLRMLSHGDLGLASFQGAGATRAGSIGSVLDNDKVQGRPLLLAPHVGYCRLAHRTGLLIVDAGPPAKCSSPLALEFSDGQHRIFSNCGMPLAASVAWQEAASGIAAHNTLEVDGFAWGTRNQPSAEVISSPRGSLARCQNRMTGQSGIITHARNLFLSHDGKDLRGEDSLSTGDCSFTIRFHLHPTVKATSVRNGAKIVLVLPNRAAWSFSARGGAVSIEESIFLSDADGPRKTQQIVILCTAPTVSSVKWALQRVERPNAAETVNGNAPPLPF